MRSCWPRAGCERTAYEAAEDPADASTDAAAKRTEQGELASMQQIRTRPE